MLSLRDGKTGLMVRKRPRNRIKDRIENAQGTLTGWFRFGQLHPPDAGEHSCVPVSTPRSPRCIGTRQVRCAFERSIER